MSEQVQESTPTQNNNSKSNNSTNDDSHQHHHQQQQVKQHEQFLPSELIVHEILPFCDRKTITNVAYGNREFYALVMKQVQMPWPTNVPLPFQKNVAIVERRRQRDLLRTNNDDGGGDTNGTNDDDLEGERLKLWKVASNGKTGTEGYIAVASYNTNDIFIQVWNCRYGYTSQLVLASLQSFITDMEFSPTIPHLLLTANSDGTVRLWDVRQNPFNSVYQFHAEDHYLDFWRGGRLLQAFFTPKGHTVTVTRQWIRFWKTPYPTTMDLDATAEHRGITPYYHIRRPVRLYWTMLELSKDGRYLVDGDRSEGKFARYCARRDNTWKQMSDIDFLDGTTPVGGSYRFTDIMKRKGTSGECYDYYYFVSVGQRGTCSFRYVEAKPTTSDTSTYWPVLFKIDIEYSVFNCQVLSMDFFPTNTKIETPTPPLYMAVRKMCNETGKVYKINIKYGEVMADSFSFSSATADVTERNQREGGNCNYYLLPWQFVDENKNSVVVKNVYDGQEVPSVMDLVYF